MHSVIVWYAFNSEFTIYAGYEHIASWEWCHINLSVGCPPGPNWRRRRGRPHTRWIDQIRQDSSTLAH